MIMLAPLGAVHTQRYNSRIAEMGAGCQQSIVVGFSSQTLVSMCQESDVSWP